MTIKAELHYLIIAVAWVVMIYCLIRAKYYMGRIADSLRGVDRGPIPPIWKFWDWK